MAALGTVKKATDVVQNTSRIDEKKVGGRPAGVKDSTPRSRESTRKKSTFDYSRHHLTFRKFSEFADYYAGYPDKQGLLCYAYRLKPRIDLSLIGIKETSILKTHIAEQMTPEHLAATFGRGMYQLKLNDANRPKGQVEIASLIIDLEDADNQPVYDLRTLLLADSRNQDEVSRLLQNGLLVRDAVSSQPRLRTVEDGPIGGAPVAAAAAHSPFGNDVMGKVILAMIDKSSQTPHEALKDTLALAEQLTPKFDVEAMVERVVARLAPAAAPPAANPFEIYSQMDTFMNKFRPAAAVTAAATEATDAATGGWAPHISGILREGKGLLAELFNDYQALRSMHAPGQNGAQPVQQQQRQLTFQERIEQVAMTGFEQMAGGMKGYDYGAWVCLHHPGGLEVFKFLEDGGGVEGVMALVAMNPVTRPILGDAKQRAQIETFLSDFFTFDADALVKASGGNAAPA